MVMVMTNTDPYIDHTPIFDIKVKTTNERKNPNNTNKLT